MRLLGKSGRWIAGGLALFALATGVPAAAQVSFSVTLPNTGVKAPVTGRLIVVVAPRSADGAPARAEPRQMIGMNGPPAFGVDDANLPPGEPTTVNATSAGFPFGLDHLPAGDYSVQQVPIPYKKEKRSTRKSVV